jgi:hypothetical protein
VSLRPPIFHCNVVCASSNSGYSPYWSLNQPTISHCPFPFTTRYEKSMNSSLLLLISRFPPQKRNIVAPIVRPSLPMFDARTPFIHEEFQPIGESRNTRHIHPDAVLYVIFQSSVEADCNVEKLLQFGCDRTSESSSGQLVWRVAEFLEVFPKI